MDGLRGALIVLGDDPYAADYDEEMTLTISGGLSISFSHTYMLTVDAVDWYHRQVPVIEAEYVIEYTDRSLLTPYSVLINEASTTEFDLNADYRYKIRVISFAGDSSISLTFEDHLMTVIEVDAVNVEKHNASTLYISPGQRYTFILAPKYAITRNYAFTATLEDTEDPTANPSATGNLVYFIGEGLSNPLANNVSQYLDDTTLIPLDGQSILSAPDQTLLWNVTLGLDSDNKPR